MSKQLTDLPANIQEFDNGCSVQTDTCNNKLKLGSYQECKDWIHRHYSNDKLIVSNLTGRALSVVWW